MRRSIATILIQSLGILSCLHRNNKNGIFVVDTFSPVLRTPSGSAHCYNSQQLQKQSRQQRQLCAKKRRDDDDDDDDDEDDLLATSDWRDFRAKLVMSETKGATSSSSSKSTEASSKAIFEDDGDLDGIGSIFQDSISTSSSSSSSIGSTSSSSQSTTKTTTSSSSTEGSSDQSQEDEVIKMTPLDPSQWAYDSGKVIEQGAVILGGVEQDFGFGLRQQYFHKAAILVLDHEESTFTKGIILNRPTDLTLEDDINKGVKWRVWFGGVSILLLCSKSVE